MRVNPGRTSNAGKGIIVMLFTNIVLQGNEFLNNLLLLTASSSFLYSTSSNTQTFYSTVNSLLP